MSQRHELDDLLSFIYDLGFFLTMNFNNLMCSIVIMEGDPHPGAMRGRMSFLSFNPSLDVSIKVE